MFWGKAHAPVFFLSVVTQRITKKKKGIDQINPYCDTINISKKKRSPKNLNSDYKAKYI